MSGQGYIDPELGAAMLRADAAAAPGPRDLRPAMLLLGGAVLVVVALVAGLLMVLGSQLHPGGITFSPSTVNCHAPTEWTMDVYLPSSLKGSDVIKVDWEDMGWPPHPLTETRYPGWSASWNQLSDGSWHGRLVKSRQDFETSCWLDTTIAQPFYYLPMNPGEHEVRIKDSSGNILASGSYTVSS